MEILNKLKNITSQTPSSFVTLAIPTSKLSF